jgi:hypothetical protein
MDGGVVESETLKRSKDSQVVTDGEQRPGTLKKYGVIAKVSEFGSKRKDEGWMITRLHFKKREGCRADGSRREG